MLNIRVLVEQAATGLWLATLVRPQGNTVLRGFLSRSAAMCAARDVAIGVYGRSPLFMGD